MQYFGGGGSCDGGEWKLLAKKEKKKNDFKFINLKKVLESKIKFEIFIFFKIKIIKNF